MTRPTARDYTHVATPTEHDCPSPASCEVPSWWQDHCSIYPVLLDYMAARERQSARIAKLSDQAIRGAGETSGPTQNRIKSAAAAWATNPNIQGGFREHLEQQFEGVVFRPRGGVNWTRTKADNSDIEIVSAAENALCYYYMPRINEAINRSRKRFSLSGLEQDELQSYAQEAFLKVIRKYDPSRRTPLQPYLRKNLTNRISDVILSERTLGRPLRDYDLACGVHMQKNPHLKTRPEAAADLGINPGRIEEFETIHKLAASSSFDGLTDPEDGLGLPETSMSPILGAPAAGPQQRQYLPRSLIDAAKAAGIEKFQKALSAEEFTAYEREVLEALMCGELDQLTESHRLPRRVVATQAKELLKRITELASN